MYSDSASARENYCWCMCPAAIALAGALLLSDVRTVATPFAFGSYCDLPWVGPYPCLAWKSILMGQPQSPRGPVSSKLPYFELIVRKRNTLDTLNFDNSPIPSSL